MKSDKHHIYVYAHVTAYLTVFTPLANLQHRTANASQILSSCQLPFALSSQTVYIIRSLSLLFSALLPSFTPNPKSASVEPRGTRQLFLEGAAAVLSHQTSLSATTFQLARCLQGTTLPLHLLPPTLNL